LQFMPDKAAALGEMHRVLNIGGRLIFNVPGPTPRLFTIMAEALERHIGPEAGGFVRQVFALNNEEEIENLISGAGFHDVSLRSDTKSLRLPPPEAFLWQYINSTPLAGAAAQAGDEPRAELEQDVVPKWEEHVKDGNLMLQVRVVSATARK